MTVDAFLAAGVFAGVFLAAAAFLATGFFAGAFFAEDVPAVALPVPVFVGFPPSSASETGTSPAAFPAFPDLALGVFEDAVFVADVFAAGFPADAVFDAGAV